MPLQWVGHVPNRSNAVARVVWYARNRVHGQTQGKRQEMRNDFGRSNHASDEIDLIEFIEGVWRQKLLVAVIVLVVTGLAGIYLFLTRPVYEAQVGVIPPMESDIADLNYGRTRASELEPYSAKQVYEIFLRDLSGEELRRSFFEHVVRPTLPSEVSSAQLRQMYRDFDGSLNIQQSSEGGQQRVTVALRHIDVTVAVDWVGRYVAMARDVARKEVVESASKEALVRADNLLRQIQTLRDNSVQIREDKLVRLREALRIAEAVGLENPPLITGALSSELASRMDGELTYMRGTKALRAEIAGLEARTTEDPYIDNLRSLQVSQAFYADVGGRKADIIVCRNDGVIDQSLVKPRKTVVMATAVVGGLVVGVIVAMFRFLLARSRRGV
ncbi:hypothetical protein DZA28_09945 [Pseudomonas alloputida]|uniref:Polysaccharide chain length determinant N-terminal domain-containing protein n=3 Tax=Pseudomonas TaxID=286 RepID=A0ABD6N4G9_9PSED|nr:hypothetical protein [Pseudomonas hunanensis]TRZ60260.1 hypothetical protein DZA28_09945 [Pseudomonas alloputida]